MAFRKYLPPKKQEKTKYMKNLFKKWNDISLILRIAIGLAIGAILGIFLPNLAFVSIFGDVFVGGLKAVAPILVFVLVVSALANAKNSVGSQFKTLIFLYMLTTLLASLLAVVASYGYPCLPCLRRGGQPRVGTPHRADHRAAGSLSRDRKRGAGRLLPGTAEEQISVIPRT